MTDEARFLKKKLQPEFGPIGRKSGPKCRFLEFGSLVFLEIAYSDSLQQCLISSRFGSSVFLEIATVIAYNNV